MEINLEVRTWLPGCEDPLDIYPSTSRLPQEEHILVLRDRLCQARVRANGTVGGPICL